MMTPEHSDQGRLIILGGGIASLTAAFYASEPGHEQVFPGGIHVFETSDRLGGKGASGRNSSDRVEHRIEEHGLHVWFGFYDNAFALLKKCHDLLEKESNGGYERWATSLRSVEDGFRPCSRVGLMDYDGASWLPWVADFPEDPTTRPWQPRCGSPTFGSPMELSVRGLQLVEAFLYSLTARTFGNPDSYSTFLDASLLPIPVQLPSTTGLTDALNRVLRASAAETGTLELISRALGLLTAVLNEARSRFDELLRQHDALRRGWYMVDLLLAAIRGMVDDGVLISGDYSLIDDAELRGWLVLHGASEESVASGFLKAIVYDLAFAYEDGDSTKPSCSAATGVYGLLRVLLTYRGAIMWKMNAGMGEVVFAPIYEALRRRGVNVHFGRQVERIDIEKRDEKHYARLIRFRIQSSRETNAELPTITVETGPLAGRLPYWDSQELGEVGHATLTLGQHDMIVYGIPVGTIQDIVNQPPPRWQYCATRVKTVPTVALQLWLSRAVDRYAPWATPDITVGAYTEPFDTWSDMKTLAGERALDGQVHSVAYFTNAAPFDLSEQDLADTVRNFMSSGLASLWPHYEPEFVIDKYERLNNDSSSCYTLSLPGTLTARLSPLDKSIANVRPVGDWTRTSLSAGCIEAAVISGMIASLALRPDRDLDIFGENMGQLAEKI